MPVTVPPISMRLVRISMLLSLSMLAAITFLARTGVAQTVDGCANGVCVTETCSVLVPNGDGTCAETTDPCTKCTCDLGSEDDPGTGGGGGTVTPIECTLTTSARYVWMPAATRTGECQIDTNEGVTCYPVTPTPTPSPDLVPPRSLADGEACVNDGQCSSLACNAGFCSSGLASQSCEANLDCVSSFCNSQICADPVLDTALQTATFAREANDVCSPTSATMPTDSPANIGCIGLNDVDNALAFVIQSAVGLFGGNQESKSGDESADIIVEWVAEVIQDMLQDFIGIDDAVPHICLGDFTAEEIQEDKDEYFEHNTCKDMALGQDTSWTVFALTLPSMMFCPELQPPTMISMCYAQSSCGVGKASVPSWSSSVSGDLLACIAAKATALTGGTAGLFAKGVQSIDSMAGGVSLGRNFASEMTIYTGSDSNATGVDDLHLTGNIYQRVGVQFSLDDFLGEKYAFFELSGSLLRLFGVQAPPDKVVDVFETLAKIDSPSDLFDLLRDTEGISIQNLERGEISIKFKDLSDVEYIGHFLGSIFPESEDIQLAQMNTFYTLGAIELNAPTARKASAAMPQIQSLGQLLSLSRQDGGPTRLETGMYAYSGVNVANVVKKIFADYITAFGETMDCLNLVQNIPGLESALDLATNIKEEDPDKQKESDFGFGYMFNTREIGFILKVPMIIAELGTITIECNAYYGEALDAALSGSDEEVDTDFRCRFDSQFDLAKAAIKYVSKKVKQAGKDARLFVAKQADSLKDSKAGKYISSGIVDIGKKINFGAEAAERAAQRILDRAGDAAEDVADEFGISLDDLEIMKTWADLMEYIKNIDLTARLAEIEKLEGPTGFKPYLRREDNKNKSSICVSSGANGELCYKDSMCESKRCVLGFCKAKLTDGSVCFDDGACYSGKCFGYLLGTGTCSSGKYDQSCIENSDCESGLFCNLARKCDHRVRDGDPCTKNSACLSGQCLGFLGDSGLCSSGKEGQTCESDSHCISGLFCDALNKCVPKLNNNAVCLKHSACASGKCLGGPGETGFCSAGSLGHTCESHSDCTSNTFCDVLRVPARCSGKKNDGSICASSNECKNNCYALRCSDGDVGESCTSDAHCKCDSQCRGSKKTKSGKTWYVEGLFCSSTKKCTDKRERNGVCLRDSMCRSNNCKAGFCQKA